MKKGFTLVETLIAVSLFTIAAVISSNILVDVVNLDKKTDVQNSIYDDARILMQQISNEIHSGTIDYEEYFNINVVQKDEKDKLYGLNYGVYASRFYDPGKSLDNDPTKNPDDLGVECSEPKGAKTADECEIIYTHSNDLNTGINPFGGEPEDADAFCNKGVVECVAGRNVVDELYLIDSSGAHKTIIGKRKMSNVADYSVGIVRMTGKDYDQNGIVDIFSCDEGYTCTNEGLEEAIKYPFDLPADISVPKQSDLDLQFNVATSHFLPFSPARSTVKSLKFIIHPFEDPYKAYAEKNVQSQPSVTIIMTLGLSAETAANYPGDFEDFTIQTTVAAGVIGKIDSYPPANEFINNGSSWIKDALSPAGF